MPICSGILTNALAGEIELHSAQSWPTNFSKARMAQVEAAGPDFAGAKLNDADLIQTNLQSTTLVRAILSTRRLP